CGGVLLRAGPGGPVPPHPLLRRADEVQQHVLRGRARVEAAEGDPDGALLVGAGQRVEERVGDGGGGGSRRAGGHPVGAHAEGSCGWAGATGRGACTTSTAMSSRPVTAHAVACWATRSAMPGAGSTWQPSNRRRSRSS